MEEDRFAFEGEARRALHVYGEAAKHDLDERVYSPLQQEYTSLSDLLSVLREYDVVTGFTVLGDQLDNQVNRVIGRVAGFFTDTPDIDALYEQYRGIEPEAHAFLTTVADTLLTEAEQTGEPVETVAQRLDCRDAATRNAFTDQESAQDFFSTVYELAYNAALAKTRLRPGLTPPTPAAESAFQDATEQFIEDELDRIYETV